MNTHQPAYWAVLPAAGIGQRMNSSRPKQYLPLLGKTILEHSLERLLSLPVARVVVAINPLDTEWPQLALSRHPKVEVAEGGAERHYSVHNSLLQLAGRAGDQDWVLVHDAVRPCVRVSCILRLMESLADHPAGGLLGYPVADTLKKVNGDRCVERTVDRSAMWAAATPQMFRYGLLREALKQMIESHQLPTDEAMAIEQLGYQPKMVSGRRDNLKITVPGDLELASLILQSQQQEEGR